jgi:formate/nitrite transporter FocA (FNT family)
VSTEPKPASTERQDAGPDQQRLYWTEVFYGRDVMDRILRTIGTKRKLQGRFHLRYVMRAMMAGLIVILLYLFAFQVRVALGPDFNPGLAHLAMASAFSVALSLIYFTNSELLTSNFMYFTVGLYYRKITLAATGAVLGSCLVGNLAGVVIAGALIASADIARPELIEAITSAAQYKTEESTAWSIFVKGIFANYFINVSVIIAMQVKEALAKMAVFAAGVIIFAFMGYEHVIANAALFTMATVFEPGSIGLAGSLSNLGLAMLGNYVGGGLVIGLFYAYLNDDRALEQH